MKGENNSLFSLFFIYNSFFFFLFVIAVVFYNITWHSDNTMNAQKYATKMHIKMPLIYTGLRACFYTSVVGGIHCKMFGWEQYKYKCKQGKTFLIE